jgi:hypothetical protein
VEPVNCKITYKNGDIIEMPSEFLDVVAVLAFGATKYGANSWLEGKHFNHKDNHASMARHLAQAFCGKKLDVDSGLDHRLHLACRSLMSYTVDKRRG